MAVTTQARRICSPRSRAVLAFSHPRGQIQVWLRRRRRGGVETNCLGSGPWERLVGPKLYVLEYVCTYKYVSMYVRWPAAAITESPKAVGMESGRSIWNTYRSLPPQCTYVMEDGIRHSAVPAVCVSGFPAWTSAHQGRTTRPRRQKYRRSRVGKLAGGRLPGAQREQPIWSGYHGDLRCTGVPLRGGGLGLSCRYTPVCTAQPPDSGRARHKLVPVASGRTTGRAQE